MNNLNKFLSLSVIITILNAQAVNWGGELSIQLKQISDLNFSSDAKKIAMVVRSAIIEGEKSEYLNQIWVANTDGSEITKFTYNEKSSTHPRFSPDGNFLAFLSARSSKKPQIWILRSNGGEAWQFTYEKDGVGSFKWSPDGDRKKRKREKRCHFGRPKFLIFTYLFKYI